MQALLTIDNSRWQQEIDEIGSYLQSFGKRLPAELDAERQRVSDALGKILAQEVSD